MCGGDGGSGGGGWGGGGEEEGGMGALANFCKFFGVDIFWKTKPNYVGNFDILQNRNWTFPFPGYFSEFYQYTLLCQRNFVFFLRQMIHKEKEDLTIL